MYNVSFLYFYYGIDGACAQDAMDAAGVALVLIGPGSVDQVCWVQCGMIMDIYDSLVLLVCKMLTIEPCLLDMRFLFDYYLLLHYGPMELFSYIFRVSSTMDILSL